jgi:tetratricopeptide (TPR) repeat protein
MARSLKASQQGLKKADHARREKGWSRQDTQWYETAQVKLSSLKRFWSRLPIQYSTFIKICISVGLDNWKDIVEWEISKSDLEDKSLSNISKSLDTAYEIGHVIPENKNSRFSSIHNNLSDLTCSDSLSLELIGREEEIKKILEYISLDHRAPIITVDGIGGIGKTSLILKVAYACIENSDLPVKIPTFDAIVFTSVKANYLYSGAIRKRDNNLPNEIVQSICREISCTLDGRSIDRGEVVLEQIYSLLGKQKTLLIIDNFEAFQEQDKDEVISFLSNIPNTTKVIITTQNIVLLPYQIQLSPLSESASIKLIKKHAESKKIDNFTDAQCQELYSKFGGHPLALIYCVGQMAGGCSLKEILDKSIQSHENITQSCFENSIELIKGKIDHQVLMALSIFAGSSTLESIVEVSGLEENPIGVSEALDRLDQLSLVFSKGGRYHMLTLTYEFAKAQLNSQPDFQVKARERCLNWYLSFSKKYGGTDWGNWYEDYDYLAEEWINLMEVMNWCETHTRDDKNEKDRDYFYRKGKDLWKYLNHCADLYGFWRDRLHCLDWLIDESRKRKEWNTYVYATGKKIWTLAMQGQNENLEKAENLFNEAWNLVQHADPKDKDYLLHNTIVLYIRKGHFEKALNLIKEKNESLITSNLQGRDRTRCEINSLYTEAKIYLETGDYRSAEKLYEEAANLARSISWLRGYAYLSCYMAEIKMKTGNLTDARYLLNKGFDIAERNNHRRRMAYYQRSFANLEKQSGNLTKAREDAAQARENFKYMGMEKDANEMNVFLRDLE